MNARRTAAIVLAMLAAAYGACAPAFAEAPQESAKLQVLSVGTDADRNVDLLLRLDADTPTPVPATAFSVSPSAGDSLTVDRLGAQGIDLVLVYAATAPTPVRRAVRGAAAEMVLTLPPGSRVGIAGSTDELSDDVASAVLALERVRADRTIHELFAEGLEQFDRSTKESGQVRSLVLFDVGPYPEPTSTVLELAKQATAYDIAVYVVRLLDGRVPAEALVEVAKRTGGAVSATDDPTGLDAAAERTLVDLQSRYDLRFRLPEPAPTAVRVSVKHGSVTASMTVPLPGASDGQPAGTNLQTTTVMLVILAGAGATVLAFALFVRIWAAWPRSDKPD